MDLSCVKYFLQKDDQFNAKGQEVLRVRAYGSSYFTLRINIRFAFFFPM